jgi:hypothetical protein
VLEEEEEAPVGFGSRTPFCRIHCYTGLLIGRTEEGGMAGSATGGARFVRGRGVEGRLVLCCALALGFRFTCKDPPSPCCLSSKKRTTKFWG